MSFIPNKRTSKPVAPFYEDTNADITRFYTTERQPSVAVSMIAEEMGKMGGVLLGVDEGVFELQGKKRMGFEIRFTLAGNLGKIRVAGLPLRNPTDLLGL